MRKNKAPGFGQREVVEVVHQDLSGILENDPLSEHFKVPSVKNTKDLLRLLLAEQQKAFGYTILEQFSYTILLRNFKLLLKKFTLEEIARGIVLSTRVSNCPGSTKIVKECILQCRNSNS